MGVSPIFYFYGMREDSRVEQARAVAGLGGPGC